MAKFYMTKAPFTNDIVEPITINLDNVLFISPYGDGALFRMINGKDLYVGERYEDIIKNITPFIPFNEMIKNRTSADSEWLHNYLKDTQKGVQFADNNNG